MDIVEELRTDPETGARHLKNEFRVGLMSLARRLCKNESDAEELVNSTFAEVVESIDNYAEQSAFFAWMCRILVRRHSRDTRRKINGSIVCDQDALNAAIDEDATERIYREVDASLLRDAIETLPDDVCKTLMMHYFMGLSVKEVARILSLSSGTIKWRLGIARQMLAAKLQTAAKKPGVKALLVALALSGLTVLGAATSLAVVRLLAPATSAPEQQAYGKNGSTGEAATPSAARTESGPAHKAATAQAETLRPDAGFVFPAPSGIAPALKPTTQEKTAMKSSTFLSFALGAAITATAPANASSRIDESDLLGGRLPAALVLDSGSGFTTNTLKAVGSNYGSEAFFDESEVSMFNMSAEDRHVDITLDTVDFFNTYSINVRKHNNNQLANRAPKSWEIYGSTTASGDNWRLLSNESGQTGWNLGEVGGDGETRLYRFKNGDQRYRRIRFKFLENNGQGTYMLVSGIKVYPATSLDTGASAATFAGCADLVPAPTTETASRYTSTSGTPFTTASLSNPGLPFAAGEPSRMVFNFRDGDDAAVNVIYEFGRETPEVVNGYLVWMANNQYSGTGNAPRSWTFSGSSDKETWTVLDERTEQYGWELGQKRWYSIDNHDAYAYYKIEFTGSNGGTRIEIGSLDYYHFPNEGVYFSKPASSVADGGFVVSGAMAADSLAADVTICAATNGIPFAIPLGARQPGEAFSVAIPGPGVLYASLVGMAAGFTNVVSAGVGHIAGAVAERFVSPDGDDGNAGTSLSAPMRHIATAVADLGSDGGAVYVLPGAYAETNDLSAVELTAPVAVIGITGDPTGAAVTAAGAPCGYARVFRLANAAALVRALTIRDGHVLNEPKNGATAAEANASLNPGSSVAAAANGGNIWIESAGGTVENCVIRDGTVERFSTAGGNVYLEGGRLSRCVLAGGKLTANLDLTEGRPCGTSLYARGGTIESCLFTNTVQSVAPVCVEGPAKLVNCTIAANKGRNAGGVVVKTSGATISNTVIYGNRATEDGGNAVWLPLVGVAESAAAARFFSCATDGGAAINDTCRLVDDTAFANATSGDWAPAALESPLVNRGADY
ncbi:MAG: sigma-70 family RNA polymerase sigma factor, partial [Kiritimatiellae bacterium]|nr:sigma-70 family RNA polymerase sigma factor [Kiritimatiellia bacterium]